MHEEKNRYEMYLKKSPILCKPHLSASPSGTDTIVRVTGQVLAPALTSFILWLLQQAIKKGVKRLYFLARDGYFMYQSAKEICKKLNLPMDCRYIYCSRYSVRIPSFHLDMEDALEYICRGGIDVTMENIMERSGIAGEEKEIVYKLLNIPFHTKQSIPYAKLSEIRNKLKDCTFFMDCVYRCSKEAMSGVSGYLRQEGLLDDVPDAIVDSGWTGSMQKILNQLLEQSGRKRALEGYYWGLYKLPRCVRKEQYHCYYFSPNRHLQEKVYFSNCLFETIFSAPHGMTLKYRLTGQKYIPVFAPYDEERRTFVEMTERNLMEYTMQIGEEIKDLYAVQCYRDRRIVKKLLKLFMAKPTKIEAETYGVLRFSDDVLDDARQEVAVLLNEKELTDNHVVNKILVMLGIRHGYIRESAWYEGSAVRAGRNINYHLMQYAMYKYLLYIRKQGWENGK